MSDRSGVDPVYNSIVGAISLAADAATLQTLLLAAVATGAGWPVLACAGAATGVHALYRYLNGRREQRDRDEFVAAVTEGVQQRLTASGVLTLDAIADVDDDRIDPQLRLLALMVQASTADAERRNRSLAAIRNVLERHQRVVQRLSAFAIRFERQFNEFARQMTDALTGLRKAHGAAMARLLAELQKIHAPPLQTPLADVVEPIDRYKYLTRWVPLFGRDGELQELHRFLDDDRPLLWWLWVGDGGVGKSRLMLEWVLDAQYLGWTAGFLPHNGSFEPGKWTPQDDTLIVVDYAAARPDGVVRGWIVALHDRAESLGKRVRFLLLERSAGETDDWYRKFRSSGSDETLLNNRRYQPPRTLTPPDEDSVWRVFEHSVRAESTDGEPPVTPAELQALRPRLLERIRQRPVQQRPLFAQFAADLVRERCAGDFAKWDAETLVKAVLDREIDKRWRVRVDAAHANLLVLATLMGGIARADAYRAADEIPRAAAALPDRATLHVGVYRVLTGFDADSNGKELPPLLPDILGECFVLERLEGRCLIPDVEGNPDAIAAAAGAALDWAWSRAPLATADFILKAVRDFPKHAAVPSLLRHRTEHERLWGALVADAHALGLAAGVSETLLAALRASSLPPALKARALCNRGVAHGQRKDLEAAITDFTAVIEMLDTPADELALALYNRGFAHDQLGDREADIADYTAVIDMPDAPPDQRARALVNLGTRHGELGDWNAAICDFTKVIAMPHAPAEMRATALRAPI